MGRAAEKAYRAVRAGILGGRYTPAARITEQDIADFTGVSRTPVREALQRLQAEGFVTVIANQGAIVSDLSAHHADDVFELRALLEAYGAARACKHVTAEAIDELRALARSQYEESGKCGADSIERIGELNSAFHHRIQALAGSERLSKLVPFLIEAPLMLRTFAHYRPEELLRSASHHLEIVRALESRDPEWAAAVMRSHILAARDSWRFAQGEIGHTLK